MQRFGFSMNEGSQVDEKDIYDFYNTSLDQVSTGTIQSNRSSGSSVGNDSYSRSSAARNRNLARFQIPEVHVDAAESSDDCSELSLKRALFKRQKAVGDADKDVGDDPKLVECTLISPGNLLQIPQFKPTFEYILNDPPPRQCDPIDDDHHDDSINTEMNENEENFELSTKPRIKVNNLVQFYNRELNRRRQNLYGGYDVLGGSTSSVVGPWEPEKESFDFQRIPVDNGKFLNGNNDVNGNDSDASTSTLKNGSMTSGSTNSVAIESNVPKLPKGKVKKTIKSFLQRTLRKQGMGNIDFDDTSTVNSDASLSNGNGNGHNWNKDDDWVFHPMTNQNVEKDVETPKKKFLNLFKKDKKSKRYALTVGAKQKTKKKGFQIHTLFSPRPKQKKKSSDEEFTSELFAEFESPKVQRHRLVTPSISAPDIYRNASTSFDQFVAQSEPVSPRVSFEESFDHVESVPVGDTTGTRNEGQIPIYRVAHEDAELSGIDEASSEGHTTGDESANSWPRGKQTSGNKRSMHGSRSMGELSGQDIAESWSSDSQNSISNSQNVSNSQIPLEAAADLSKAQNFVGSEAHEHSEDILTRFRRLQFDSNGHMDIVDFGPSERQSTERTDSTNVGNFDDISAYQADAFHGVAQQAMSPGEPRGVIHTSQSEGVKGQAWMLNQPMNLSETVQTAQNCRDGLRKSERNSGGVKLDTRPPLATNLSYQSSHFNQPTVMENQLSRTNRVPSSAPEEPEFVIRHYSLEDYFQKILPQHKWPQRTNSESEGVPSPNLARRGHPKLKSCYSAGDENGQEHTKGNVEHSSDHSRSGIKRTDSDATRTSGYGLTEMPHCSRSEARFSLGDSTLDLRYRKTDNSSGGDVIHAGTFTREKQTEIADNTGLIVQETQVEMERPADQIRSGISGENLEMSVSVNLAMKPSMLKALDGNDALKVDSQLAVPLQSSERNEGNVSDSSLGPGVDRKGYEHLMNSLDVYKQQLRKGKHARLNLDIVEIPQANFGGEQSQLSMGENVMNERVNLLRSSSRRSEPVLPARDFQHISNDGRDLARNPARKSFPLLPVRGHQKITNDGDKWQRNIAQKTPPQMPVSGDIVGTQLPVSYYRTVEDDRKATDNDAYTQLVSGSASSAHDFEPWVKLALESIDLDALDAGTPGGSTSAFDDVGNGLFSAPRNAPNWILRAKDLRGSLTGKRQWVLEGTGNHDNREINVAPGLTPVASGLLENLCSLSHFLPQSLSSVATVLSERSATSSGRDEGYSSGGTIFLDQGASLGTSFRSFKDGRFSEDVGDKFGVDRFGKAAGDATQASPNSSFPISKDYTNMQVMVCMDNSTKLGSSGAEILDQDNLKQSLKNTPADYTSLRNQNVGSECEGPFEDGSGNKNTRSASSKSFEEEAGYRNASSVRSSFEDGTDVEHRLECAEGLERDDLGDIKDYSRAGLGSDRIEDDGVGLSRSEGMVIGMGNSKLEKVVLSTFGLNVSVDGSEMGNVIGTCRSSKRKPVPDTEQGRWVDSGLKLDSVQVKYLSGNNPGKPGSVCDETACVGSDCSPADKSVLKTEYYQGKLDQIDQHGSLGGEALITGDALISSQGNVINIGAAKSAVRWDREESYCKNWEGCCDESNVCDATISAPHQICKSSSAVEPDIGFRLDCMKCAEDACSADGSACSVQLVDHTKGKAIMESPCSKEDGESLVSDSVVVASVGGKAISDSSSHIVNADKENFYNIDSQPHCDKNEQVLENRSNVEQMSNLDEDFVGQTEHGAPLWGGEKQMSNDSSVSVTGVLNDLDNYLENTLDLLERKKLVKNRLSNFEKGELLPQLDGMRKQDQPTILVDSPQDSFDVVKSENIEKVDQSSPPGGARRKSPSNPWPCEQPDICQICASSPDPSVAFRLHQSYTSIVSEYAKRNTSDLLRGTPSFNSHCGKNLFWSSTWKRAYVDEAMQTEDASWGQGQLQVPELKKSRTGKDDDISLPIEGAAGGEGPSSISRGTQASSSPSSPVFSRRSFSSRQMLSPEHNPHIFDVQENEGYSSPGRSSWTSSTSSMQSIPYQRNMGPRFLSQRAMRLPYGLFSASDDLTGWKNLYDSQQDIGPPQRTASLYYAQGYPEEDTFVEGKVVDRILFPEHSVWKHKRRESLDSGYPSSKSSHGTKKRSSEPYIYRDNTPDRVPISQQEFEDYLSQHGIPEADADSKHCSLNRFGRNWYRSRQDSDTSSQWSGVSAPSWAQRHASGWNPDLGHIYSIGGVVKSDNALHSGAKEYDVQFHSDNALDRGSRQGSSRRSSTYSSVSRMSEVIPENGFQRLQTARHSDFGYLYHNDRLDPNVRKKFDAAAKSNRYYCVRRSDSETENMRSLSAITGGKHRRRKSHKKLPPIEKEVEEQEENDGETRRYDLTASRRLFDSKKHYFYYHYNAAMMDNKSGATHMWAKDLVKYLIFQVEYILLYSCWASS
jgi:hypothetical protein